MNPVEQGIMGHHPPASTSPNPTWLLDLIASHHVSTDPQNLVVHFECGGTDEIAIVNSTKLPIIHTGTT